MIQSALCTPWPPFERYIAPIIAAISLLYPAASLAAGSSSSLPGTTTAARPCPSRATTTRGSTWSSRPARHSAPARPTTQRCADIANLVSTCTHSCSIVQMCKGCQPAAVPQHAIRCKGGHSLYICLKTLADTSPDFESVSLHHLSAEKCECSSTSYNVQVGGCTQPASILLIYMLLLAEAVLLSSQSSPA